MKKNKKSIVSIRFPYSEKFLQALFEEFEWEWEKLSEPHPEQIENCNHGNRARGARERCANGYAGFYENPASYCVHCYPNGNPARLLWAEEEGRGEIIVEAFQGGTKPLQAMLLFYQLEVESGMVIEKLPNILNRFGE